ncbi:MAG: peptidoglycan DD-metalloendopeptidase family protein [Bdellovibrionaceae bacterium]|nr:peptidoglycan DD-metalloendopeptidase family protein [Pseudobdellovibrionaceae bacterium]
MNFDFSSFQFSPVIDLPNDYEVYDFTQDYDPDRPLSSDYGIGRYNEKRPSMYTHEQYQNIRNIHMGVDIAAPVGTPIKSFFNGKILNFANNARPGDYGFTIVLEYILQDKILYALFGHLSENSLKNKKIGQSVSKDEVIAWIGNKSENGGWNPHLHFQLSWQKPEVADMPGVVSTEDHEEALRIYPDPRLVLGDLYD